MKICSKHLMGMKGKKQIPMLTAYTCSIARSIELAGVPVILVGDTVGMVEMGFSNTRDVTMEHMEYHIGAVRRGAQNTHIIGDLPYLADADPCTALNNAERLLEAGADSIKLEGPKLDVIKYLVENGVSVVGHTGLTPQTALNFKKVGGTESEAIRVAEEAKAIQGAGAFMVVLEHIPSTLAQSITSTLSIPTIGIGAGPNCDGQVLVINDALGIGDYWPPFSKQYSYVSKTVFEVAKTYCDEVESFTFL
ncbi:3-methyl-2-oxobutanoate hydroxymethyltransferase [Vibrio mediterranei]|uniref:3-methyl-2-oxobutanoate hydroxymethyltransferase n=1 Tax=Vibrio mediterranei TaxID=689 RepID=UPI001EFE1BF9|nr:3-methyl-2-oxobutanoate hydroxymethyltransferase [Vibrio mediterranei]MCG9629017.1 3-methyl-2-oxobutanoate hydroxymethyltransferase [Vibrio mediterranei]